jgi:hypothetical protein
MFESFYASVFPEVGLDVEDRLLGNQDPQPDLSPLDFFRFNFVSKDQVDNSTFFAVAVMTRLAYAIVEIDIEKLQRTSDHLSQRHTY